MEDDFKILALDEMQLLAKYRKLSPEQKAEVLKVSEHEARKGYLTALSADSSPMLHGCSIEVKS